MMIPFYKRKRSGTLYYYAIHDRQATLFPSHSFTVIWGEELSTGREKHYCFENRKLMESSLIRVINKRIKDGYRVLYKYSREPRYEKIFHTIDKALA